MDTGGLFNILSQRSGEGEEEGKKVKRKGEWGRGRGKRERKRGKGAWPGQKYLPPPPSSASVSAQRRLLVYMDLHRFWLARNSVEGGLQQARFLLLYSEPAELLEEALLGSGVPSQEDKGMRLAAGLSSSPQAVRVSWWSRCRRNSLWHRCMVVVMSCEREVLMFSGRLFCSSCTNSSSSKNKTCR